MYPLCVFCDKLLETYTFHLEVKYVIKLEVCEHFEAFNEVFADSLCRFVCIFLV